MREVEIKVLNILSLRSRLPRVELQEKFGDTVKRIVGSLGSKGLVTEEVIDGIPTVTVTEQGRLRAHLNRRCDVCECDPCDCNWGH